MILHFYFLALVAYQALAAPANSSQPLLQVNATQTTSDTSLFSQFTLYTDYSSIAPITSALSVSLTSLLGPTDAAFSQLTESNDSSSTVPVTSPPSLTPEPLSLSPSLAPSLTTTAVIATEIETAYETSTVDVTPSPASLVTVVVTAIATTTIITTPTPSWDNRTLWVAPPQMTDLSAFNVTYFPSGKRNLHIVAQIPSKAISPTAKFLKDPLFSPNTTSPSTILQLVYPAHSVNPGSKPEGGADFYATPLNLAGARNVTLEYSIFFPADFDWVKGGKLPGLFGGHTGCSGGASARDCFSTRLMWRPQGVGELYLYAPKDKQSDALCADVQSVCDASYGFSVGRGAFNFAAGDWTRLAQHVVLNTPGRNDGGFTLVVDGRPAIERADVFYRDVARPSGKTKLMQQPAEFVGLFFSTFFGGHGDKYATPRQQYIWFKDFAITRHD